MLSKAPNLEHYFLIVFQEYFLFSWTWSGTKATITVAIYWPVMPALHDGDDCEAISVMNDWHGKQQYSEKSCPSAALSTTKRSDISPGL
jgi:hypothetical protein